MNYSINTSNQQTQSDNQMNWNTQSLVNNQSNIPISTNQMNYLQFQNMFQPTIIPTYANCYKKVNKFLEYFRWSIYFRVSMMEFLLFKILYMTFL